LAKNSFSVCGVDVRVHVILRKTLRRDALLPFFAQQSSAGSRWSRGPARITGRVACRRWATMPALSIPGSSSLCRIQGASGKNDSNDAEAICEAAGRPRMRFVPVKSVEQ
jgi:transposase